MDQRPNLVHRRRIPHAAVATELSVERAQGRALSCRCACRDRRAGSSILDVSPDDFDDLTRVHLSTVFHLSALLLVVVVFREDNRVAFAIGREQSQVVSLIVGSAPRINGRDHRKSRSHRLELCVRILDRVDDQAGRAVGAPDLNALRAIRGVDTKYGLDTPEAVPRFVSSTASRSSSCRRRSSLRLADLAPVSRRSPSFLPRPWVGASW